MPTSNPQFWRLKINALLHDTPDKATDIRSHEQRAAQIKGIHDFVFGEYFDKSSDWRASAADRLPFPDPSKLTQPLDGIPHLVHPLGGSKLPFEHFKTSTEALEVSQKTHPFLLDNDDSCAAFICIWRFWRNWACSCDPRFTRLPADTRIPDHTIWNHLNVTTAFQGSLPPKDQENDPNSAPRLLLFSIGPVQDFIAAARSTRDLWSGSYLLSYLVSHVLGIIARELGPDHVIFPNLLDQPLIDLQLKEIFTGVKFSEKLVWDGFEYTTGNLSKLLTPSLPNRFMALVPAVHPESGQTAGDFAKHLANSVRTELRKIADSVATFLTKNRDPEVCEFDHDKFNAQVDRLMEIQWQALPIPRTIGDLYQTADSLLPKDDETAQYTPRTAVDAVLKMVKISACTPQYNLSPETGWSLLNALIAYLHDGVKSTRSFDAWREGRWSSGTEFNKDALNGKEEAVLTLNLSKKEEAEKYCFKYFIEPFDEKDRGTLSKSTLKPGELLGASTLIKRFWHHTYLPDKLDILPHKLRSGHPMPNTHAVAAGDPFSDADEEGESRDHSDKYFAILALDGDEMGKWVSGSKTPPVGELLSPKAKDFYGKNAPGFLDAPRAVTPSWHLQFAEALGNFSFHAVQRIVEAYDGRLIYAGGDDVLAMLPAKDAINCARSLRAAFRGEQEHLNKVLGAVKGKGKSRKSDRDLEAPTPLFDLEHEGFLQLHEQSGARYGDKAGILSDPVKFPAIVPGPRSDVSVGIAIAHYKSPLQDVVRAAQSAEKRAKRSSKEGGFDRGALAVTIYKRSGEILEWGTRWSIWEKDEKGKDKYPTSHETAGYQLLHLLSELLLRRKLNARFPYKLEGLLSLYQADSRSVESDQSFVEHFDSILQLELDHCVSRNEGNDLRNDEQDHLRTLFSLYWKEVRPIKPNDFPSSLTRFINLLRTAAWSVRVVKSDETQSQPAHA